MMKTDIRCKASRAEKEPWLVLDIQRVLFSSELPSDEEFEHWVACALQQAAQERINDEQFDSQEREGNELAIRIVDEEEGGRLNEQWRHKKGATNVLSFAMSGLDMIVPELLGDIVICAPVIKREAEEQCKALEAHWAHMVVHGVLHLIGYDHTMSTEAEIMEHLETKIILALGYPDPYQSL